MHIFYKSNKKTLCRIVSIGLILLISIFTVMIIPKEEKEKSKKNIKKEVNNIDPLYNVDDENSDLFVVDNILNTLENVVGSMDDIDDNSENPENVMTSEVITTNKTACIAKSDTSTNNKTSSGSKEDSEASESSDDSERTSRRIRCSSSNDSNDKSEEQLFIPRVYSLEGVSGKTVSVKLTGTNNAYTDGIYKYKNEEGDYVEKNWSTELNSNGNGSVTINIPVGASDAQFHILWAGVWNEDETVALARECKMESYECK